MGSDLVGPLMGYIVPFVELNLRSRKNKHSHGLLSNSNLIPLSKYARRW